MILTNFQLKPNLSHFPFPSKSCNKRENTLNKTQMVKTPNNQTHSHSYYHTKCTQPLKYPFKMFDKSIEWVTCDHYLLN